MNKKTVIALVLVLAAAAIGFSVKMGPDPVNVVKMCPVVFRVATNGLIVDTAERCDLR